MGIVPVSQDDYVVAVNPPLVTSQEDGIVVVEVDSSQGDVLGDGSWVRTPEEESSKKKKLQKKQSVKNERREDTDKTDDSDG